MRPRPRRSLLLGPPTVLATLVVATASAPPDAADDLHRAPTRPLDPRIDPTKITEQDPAPLPEAIILPLPATHRIAASATEVPIDEAHWTLAHASLARGLDALRAAQDVSGGWMLDAGAAPTPRATPPDEADAAPASPVTVAVTALALKALVQAAPPGAATPETERAVRFILASREPDGGFGGGSLSNYVTATVVSALAGADEFAFSDEIAGAVATLRRNQWDQGEGLNARQDWFGGAGYGNRGRPDLSNTQMMLEALYDAGLSPSEPEFQRALTFVSRTQNLRATNDAAWAGDDGGFVYTPAGGGESMASEYAGEGRYGEHLPADAPRSLRSYGSMTYAGFKTLLYAGLSPDDLRVRAAFDWVRRHWTFDENPGLGDQGLYYYYHAMSRALRVAQQTIITDTDGRPHNWREELIDALARRQADDGTWANTADRWLEGEPVLATAYALLALEEAMKPGASDGATKRRSDEDDRAAEALP